MSWNECLYQYHKKCGGQFLGGREDDGLLVLTWKDRPLAVDLSVTPGGRGSTFYYVRARVPVSLAKPYKLTIGAEKKSSAGVNAVLKAVPSLPESSILPADFGFPEVTKKRLITSDNYPFTKLVLGSLELRNTLLACPEDRVEVRPGPGTEGLHLITVTTARSLFAFGGDSGSWYVGDSGDYTTFYGSEEDRRREVQRVEEEFFPRMDRFLDLTRAAYSAVTQWPM